MTQKSNAQTKDKNTDEDSVICALGIEARKASAEIAQSSTTAINDFLQDLATTLINKSADIIAANQKDLSLAKEKALSPALIDRLTLNPNRIEVMANSVIEIAKLDDPVGVVLETTQRPNGLVIEKVSVPIGILGMIYESRPNVTIDAAALCLKSRNAVILRGGSESFHTSTFLHGIIQNVLKDHNLPVAAVSMVPSTDRALVGEMLQAHEYIDVIIPRGGKGLTGRVMAEAKMPVFAHLDGNCHVFIHRSANEAMTLDIVKNAKLRRTGICGAAESLLCDKALKHETVQAVVKMLLDEGVEIVGDDEFQKLDTRIQPASEEDWSTEYLDKKISCKFVEDYDEAIEHINRYGSHHTDAILAEDKEAAKEFQTRVDSAIVIHNASTQFADGGEFGMGAEIGIGTGKLHARGPVGLKQLTTFKYLVKGEGQTRPV